MKSKKVVTKDVPEESKPEVLAAYLKLVEAYKVQNPVKYQMKKAHFEAKLAELGYKPE